MSRNQLTFFDGQRLTLADSLDLTAQSLAAYALDYRHWAIAYSGGKDSTATVAAVTYLIATGRVPAPETLTILYADTRQELPPLHLGALEMLAALDARGYPQRWSDADPDATELIPQILSEGVTQELLLTLEAQP